MRWDITFDLTTDTPRQYRRVATPTTWTFIAQRTGDKRVAVDRKPAVSERRQFSTVEDFVIFRYACSGGHVLNRGQVQPAV